MRYLSIGTVIYLHEQLILESGGAAGLRDHGLLESALAQPRASFGGQDLHQTLADKAAVLAFSLISNHPFVDGNKRIGHYAMRVFLRRNRHTLVAPVDEQEIVILSVAAGKMNREAFTDWVRQHIVAL